MGLLMGVIGPVVQPVMGLTGPLFVTPVMVIVDAVAHAVARPMGLMGVIGPVQVMGLIGPVVQPVMGLTGPVVQPVMGAVGLMVQLVMGPFMVIVDVVVHGEQVMGRLMGVIGPVLVTGLIGPMVQPVMGLTGPIMVQPVMGAVMGLVMLFMDK